MIDELPLYHRFFLLNTYVNLYYYQEKYEKSWEYLMKIFPDMEHERKMPATLPFWRAIMPTCPYSWGKI